MKEPNAGDHLGMCQSCVYRYHPIMLTGYCLTGMRCDTCGTVSDLAMVVVKDKQ